MGHEKEAGDLLQAFLATHDAPCPVCGHNLRGAPSGRCPECGHVLALGVRATDSLASRRTIVAIVLLGLLLVGGMRSYGAVRSTLRRSRSQFVVTAPIGPLVTTNPAPNLAPSPGATWRFDDAAPGAAVDLDAVADELRVAAETMARESLGARSMPTAGRAAAPEASDTFETVETVEVLETEGPTDTVTATVTVAPPPRPPLLTSRRAPVQVTTVTRSGWQRLGWSRWASVAWWTTLTAAAAAALVTLAVHRRRPASSRVARAVVGTAVLGLVGLVAFEGVQFVGALV